MTQRKNKPLIHAIQIGLLINIGLAAIKLTFGAIGNAQALFSDGLNSFSDVIISIMLLIFMSIASKKPDQDHPYGHEKFEGLAYFTLGIIFLLLAIYVGYQAIESTMHLLTGNYNVVKPEPITIYISLIALVIKLALYVYLKRVSHKHDTPTLKADAKNHLLDAWATFAALIGLSLTQLNFIIFDYIASFLIGLLILKLAIDVLKDSISYLTDQAPSLSEIDLVYGCIKSIPGVLGIDDLKIRKHMTKRYIDVEISVDGALTLVSAHKIAENVHRQVEKKFPDVIHCMVHVNPHQ